MANVIFKRGLQSDLNSVAKQDGVFYLTTDTGRLYVDIDNDRKILNQTVQFISSLEALQRKSTEWGANKAAHINDIYYIQDSNILAVFTNGAEDGGWVQINPDTNNYITSGSASVGAIVNNSSQILINVVDDVGHTVTATFGIVGAGGVTLDVDNNNLVVESETYTISSSVNNTHDQATINLNNSSTVVSAVNLVANDTNVSFEAVNNGIKVVTQNTTLSSTSVNVTLPSAGTLNVEVRDKDGNGNAQSLSNLGIVLNDNTFVPLDSTAGKSAGALYSKDEIDTMINGLNGMTYKGTYGSTGADISALPTTGVHAGDVYVIVEEGLTSTSFPGVTIDLSSSMANGTRAGDMLIAAGTETDGVITDGLHWTYVPSGNDDMQAFSYQGIATTSNNIMELRNDLGTSVASWGLTAGTGIVISSVASTTSSMATTIEHAQYTTTSTTASSVSDGTSFFTAIKGITVNNGHVTNIETDTFTPVTYHLTGASTTQISAFSTTANAGTNSVDVEIGITDSEGANNLAGASFNVSSSSIKMTAGNNGAVTMNIEWGTFGS